MALERLDKLLASTGRWSRKEVKDLVRQGRVLVNGRPVLRSEEKWEPTETELTVDGRGWTAPPSSISCSISRRVCCPPRRTGISGRCWIFCRSTCAAGALFPVGRLDKDTEGLLLLTDDGPLGHALLSPKRHVDKVYLARVDGVVDQSDVEALARGMVLGDGLHCLPAGWSRWRMAGSAWSLCGRGSTTR